MYGMARNEATSSITLNVGYAPFTRCVGVHVSTEIVWRFCTLHFKSCIIAETFALSSVSDLKRIVNL